MTLPLPIAAASEFWASPLPLVALGLVVFLLGALVLLVARLQTHVSVLLERLATLDRLDAIAAHVRALAEQEDGLDLRRLEHVLVDIRDGQRRVEERLLGLVESLEQSRDVLRPQGASVAHPASTLAERVTTRMLALGYERVELLTPLDELERLGTQDGELVVEARKGGSSHKGRVSVRGGAIVDVKLRPTYESFP